MWPIDSIVEKPANGYFLRDLLIFNGLNAGGFASKGFIFEPPDFNNAQIGELNEFQDQLSILLASLSDNQRLEVQWFCDSDYQRELLRYNDETKRATNVWTRRARNERFARYWTAMTKRQFRRQRLILYISRSIETSPSFSAPRSTLTTHYEHLLDQLEQEFAQVHETLNGIFSGQGARIIPMKDADHYRHFTAFLNPSLAERFNYDALETFDPLFSIQQNCWHGEGNGQADFGFWMDFLSGRAETSSRFVLLTLRSPVEKTLAPRMTAEDQLREAKALRQKGRHAEALEIAQTVAAFYPENADAWWVAGLAAQSLKKLPESLLSLKEMIKLAPRWAPGWAQYGLVLEENGQKEEGKKALHQAINIKPDHVFAHRQLARIFKEEENFDGQILHLTRVDDLGEMDGDDMNLLGIAHWRKKHFARAIEYYLRSAKLGAGPYPYFNLALVYSHVEVSQDVDATDSLRRAIAVTADYQPAIKKLGELTPRLFGLAQEVLKQGETLLHLGECFQFYLNPLEMVGFDRDQDIEELNTKRIQRLRKAVLQEIDLEDGALQNLDGFDVDKSRAIGLCEELLDEKLRRYHWQVFKNPFLLWFMTRGDIRHFLHSESSFPLETLEALDEDEFRRWLSEPFARQYDLVLSRSIERRAVRMVESLFDGRRWVVPEHDDICFAGAHRQVERLLEPLKKAAERAKEEEPDLAAIQDLLTRNRLVEILDLLPMYFRDQQSQAVRHIRDMAIAAYNAHDNTDLSKAILLLSKKFVFKSTELCQRLDDDFKKIDELIQEERKHEAKLTLGDKPMEVTKDGVRQGERFLPVTHIRSIRWGIAVTGYQHAPTYEFLMAFRDDDLSEVIISWRSSNNLEQQEKHFQKLVEAALTYIVPSIVVRVQQQFGRREQVRVGTCTMKREGVVFDTPGWFSAKTHLVSWSQVGTDLENGRLSVYDRANPKTRITMPLREAENAVVLRFLASAKK